MVSSASSTNRIGGKSMVPTSNTLSTKPRLIKTAFVALSVATVLAGCAPRNSLIVGATPQDYRTNHPIIVSEQEKTLDIPVASGDRELTLAAKETIRGFVANYRSNASGTIRIMVPSGSVNSGAASVLRGAVRSEMIHLGVPTSRIIESPYEASAHGNTAPIRLSYHAVSASAGECGKWPEDLAKDTSQNRNYANFGCAYQNNLAAQIANPMDLLAPRGMSPIDATRRGNAIKTYREDGMTNFPLATP